MRNLGDSIGIAALATFLSFREQYHFSIGNSRSLAGEGHRGAGRVMLVR